MSPHLSSDCATWRLPDNLDLQLLHDAQACLRCRARRQTPSKAEEQAWEWFYQTYDPLLRGWVLGCHVAADNVEDYLQEVRTEVIKKLPAFASDGMQRGLCCWLRAIVHAKVTDLLRYQSRHPTKRLRFEVEATLLSRDTGPAAEHEHHGRQEAIQHVLAVLRQQVSTLTYSAFYKHWVEGHT